MTVQQCDTKMQIYAIHLMDATKIIKRTGEVQYACRSLVPLDDHMSPYDT